MSKHNIWIPALLLFMASGLKALDISTSVNAFKGTDKAYIEIYSKFKSNGLQWASPLDDASVMYSEVEMQCIISKGEEIVVAEKYNISSPTSANPVDYWDLKRYQLLEGQYQISIRYVDLNNIVDTLNFESPLNLQFSDQEICISDILLIENLKETESELAFNRQSFSYEPLEYNLLASEGTNLIFYAELYNLMTHAEESMFIQYYLENTDAEGLDKFSKTGYKRIEPAEMVPVLIDFPVEELLSGNYILHLQLNDRNKRMLAEQKTAVSIYHPYQDYKRSLPGEEEYKSSIFQFMTEDELNYSLKAIFPRMGNTMTEIVNYIIRSDEIEPKRYFLFSFWSNIAPENMQAHYDAYMEVAKAVDNTYMTNVFHGFETDRGRIFLKYGKPDDLVFEEDEQTAPPYEIWIYNNVPETQQTNVKFLFYNPSLAANDFILLHSNCRGERNNPRWELDLYSDAVLEQPSNYIDGRQMPSNFNRNARRYFTDF